MSSIAQVAEATRKVLTTVAEAAGRASGFVQRASKLDGATFTQALVLGFQAHPQATLGEIAQMAAAVGVEITPQGLEQRFTPQAAACLQQVLEVAVQEVVTAEGLACALLQRFRGVYLQDSTTLALPAALADLWPGCGNQTGASAALKVQVQWNYLTGELSHLHLQPGRAQDRNAPVQHVPLPAGALRLADLGYFSLDVLAHYDAQGVYWLSRYHVQAALYDSAGQRLDLVAYLRQQAQAHVEVAVQLGAAQRLACRLLAVRVPQEVADRRRQRLQAQARKKGQAVSQRTLALADWTLLITNVPIELLTLEEALVMARVRWQIELLFKRWKSLAHLSHSRSQKPWTILCELYAKLLGCVMHHWQLLLSSWGDPTRSFAKVTRILQQHTLLVVHALASLASLVRAFEALCRVLRVGCRLEKRRQHPATFQLLLALEQLDMPHVSLAPAA